MMSKVMRWLVPLRLGGDWVKGRHVGRFDWDRDVEIWQATNGYSRWKVKPLKESENSYDRNEVRYTVAPSKEAQR